MTNKSLHQGQVRMLLSLETALSLMRVEAKDRMSKKED